jgi:hypothetical protein
MHDLEPAWEPTLEPEIEIPINRLSSRQQRKYHAALQQQHWLEAQVNLRPLVVEDITWVEQEVTEEDQGNFFEEGLEGSEQVATIWEELSEENSGWLGEANEEFEEGPGPSTAANWDINIDEQRLDFRNEEPPKGLEAGKILNPNPTLSNQHAEWRRKFNVQDDTANTPSPNPFCPFTSEIDWQIADWAIQEGLSQSVLDRLLKIPTVSIFHVRYIPIPYRKSRFLQSSVYRSRIPDPFIKR